MILRGDGIQFLSWDAWEFPGNSRRGEGATGSDAWRGTECLFSAGCEVPHVVKTDAWSTQKARISAAPGSR